MSSKLGICLILIFAALLAETTTLPAAPPASPSELAERMRTACDKKDVQGFLDLYYWQGVSEQVKTQLKGMPPFIFQQSNVTNVAALSLPANFQKGFTRNGITYVLNLPPEGIIGLECKLPASTVQPRAIGSSQISIPYGKGPDGYYLTTQVSGKQGAAENTPGEPDKMITIIATTAGWQEFPELSMDYGYFSGKKEIKLHAAEKAVISQNFLGKSVEYCNLKTTATRGTTRLQIKVGGIDVFDSKDVDAKTTREIDFKGKN